MILLWHHYWPALTAAVLIGVLAGWVMFRRLPRRRRAWAIAGGALAVLGVAALWHGPLGASDAFTGRIERAARAGLDHLEVPQVHARFQREPLTRHILLSGPADDFQRAELVRIMSEVPGVSGAGWSARGSRIPMIAEIWAAALIAFGIGLLLSYLLELHRRANAQWRW